MSAAKSSKLQTPVQTQGKAVRKLKLLLQRWWQEHSENALGDRQDYLNCAMLFGAAIYLTQLENGPTTAMTSEQAVDSALAILKTLWQQSYPQKHHSKDFDSLINNKTLQKEFLTLTKNLRASAAFRSPLCPAFIYEAFSFAERRISKDLIQDDRRQMDFSHLISFTQVYTPAWVVDHLLQNTLGQAITSCPDVESLKEIKLLDPALGGGVFLVQALETFVEVYRGMALSLEESIKQSLDHNLFGLDIDSMALRTASLCLILKCFSLGLGEKPIKILLPFKNLYLVENENNNDNDNGAHQYPLGSLCTKLRQQNNHPLNSFYDVVVANPPYLGRKLLPRPLKEKLKRLYPGSACDLSQAFLTMALELTKPGGSVGFITQASFLHLANAKTLRRTLLTKHQIVEVVELGAGVFPMIPGEKVSTALITINNEKPSSLFRGRYLSLMHEGDKSSKLKNLAFNKTADDQECSRLQSDFLQNNDCAINYLRPQAVSRLRDNLPKLSDIAALKQGLATTNNARFLRYIWEVPKEDLVSRYVPYVRGDGGERWWSPLTTLVLWHNNGLAIKEAVSEAYPYLKGNYRWVVKNEEYYFKSGLTFSFVSRDRLAVRQLAAGAIFDVGSSAIFAHEKINEDALLAYLNSGLATALAHDLNPTINFQVGDLKKIVIPNFSTLELNQLQTLARDCVAAKQKLFALTSPLKFFQQDKYLPLPSAITGAAFEQADTIFRQQAAAIIAWEEQIDNIVVAAALRHTSLKNDDMEAIGKFADRPRLKATVSLSPIRFIQAALIEALLYYLDTDSVNFFESETANLKVVMANLKNEEDVAEFFKLLAIDIDISFIREYLENGKDLMQFCLEDLPAACNDIFLSQSPIIFATVDDHTIVVASHAGLCHSLQDVQWQLHECGKISPSTKSRVLELLKSVKTQNNLAEKRPKELGRDIANILDQTKAAKAQVI